MKSEQNQEKLAELQAIRNLYIINALDSLKKGTYRIKNFFYLKPTQSGIEALKLNDGEDQVIVGVHKNYNNWTLNMEQNYIVISERVSFGLEYPMGICGEVAEGYLDLENMNDLFRINDKEEIYKLQYFLASVFGIY